MASSQLLQNLGEGVTYASSKMPRAQNTSAVWEVKIPDFSSAYSLDILTFDMDIGRGDKIRFSLNRNANNLELRLGFSGTNRAKIIIGVGVDCLDKFGIKTGTVCSNKRVSLCYLGISESFASLDTRLAHDHFDVSLNPNDKHYIFLLTVTHRNHKINIPKAENGSEDCKKSFESRFLQQMKDGFYDVNKYPDITLISSDLMEHGAHKFMLAARSPILAKTIEEEVKKEAFDGKIQLDIGAKPLIAILHWMYTGELHDKAGKCMKDVVAAAVKYELPDLLKLLDKELITICENENMAVVFSLLEIAKEHEMDNARKEIGKFIRKNLQD